MPRTILAELRTTNAPEVVAMVDASNGWSLTFTAAAAERDVCWSVYAANAEDFSDETRIYGQDVAAGKADCCTLNHVLFNFYRIRCRSGNDGEGGIVTVRGLLKLI